ncbi:hypothetical protein [Rhodococcus qingshengii]|uniref:hypothetical protein n=1 Tax=Rhodococcus qingshengii TaxID=334542 RepID=UPI00071D285D|nr:hypothetical protein [Rhodococcus qingshengii]KSU77152.1 hypothetical protein AS032_14665 [Rhodococcus qingshengii]SCC37460.1 hypothetical protein GA0061093_107155 [Rhodococcus qingshengii]
MNADDIRFTLNTFEVDEEFLRGPYVEFEYEGQIETQRQLTGNTWWHSKFDDFFECEVYVLEFGWADGSCNTPEQLEELRADELEESWFGILRALAISIAVAWETEQGSSAEVIEQVQRWHRGARTYVDLSARGVALYAFSSGDEQGALKEIAIEERQKLSDSVSRPPDDD